MNDSAAGIPVQLGARSYSIVPQRIGRISRKLSAVVTVAQVADGSADMGESITDRLYEALEVFIPDIAPRHELAGYGSADDYAYVTGRAERDEVAREAFAATSGGGKAWADLTPEEQDGFTAPEFVDPYDEARDKSPTPMELADAMDAIFQAHGGQRLVRLLGNVIGPEAIRAVLRNELIRWASSRSSALPSSNGGPETSTTPSTPPETPAPSMYAEDEQIGADMTAHEAATQPTDPSPPASAA